MLSDILKRDGRVLLLLHRLEPRDEIANWLAAAGYSVASVNFQEDEEVIRRLKEGGPPEKYRSFIFKLYEVRASSSESR